MFSAVTVNTSLLVYSVTPIYRGSMPEWFRALVLWFGGPGCKASTLPSSNPRSRFVNSHLPPASEEFQPYYVYLEYLLPLFQWHAVN